jgi:hypothetical protein
MVDHCTEVMPTEKFSYMLALMGQVLQLVQGLPTAPENYSIAWNVQVERYENKKLIVTTYVRKLLG